ncbi:uncharacterized protein KGF55_000360 [Candida pseudojiufengensis]|uniref:uncharacterized protein n=1 Tax=Candida pseudojiufengensis TaxID=497109 RepID=UPI0022244199|nr:uncharacterized protein KGF55_000360 [Candida pseudojiufengensis]KAI5966951.1 hypothetical protein KGF55_000360 [Candida pseudojiufengensis]
MSLICAISGELVKNPIVSPKSGAIFEKKYIEKYVQTTGTDPINNEALSKEELISLNLQASTTTAAPSTTIAAPPSTSVTSIPNLLSTLQNEYDSMVLEIFTLRKNLQHLKLELSSSLYKADAAVIVAAKALRERNEAREALEKLIASIEVNNKEEVEDKIESRIEERKEQKEMEVKEDEPVENGRPASIQDIVIARDSLFKLHKSQKPKFPYDKTKKLKLKSMDVDKQLFKNKNLFVTYNSHEKQFITNTPKRVKVYDSITEKLREWDPQLSTINSVTINNNGLLLAASKLKIKFSNNDTLTLKSHIQLIVCHPSLNLFVVIDNNHIHVTNTKEILSTYSYPNVRRAEIHVDGELLAVIIEQEIKIINLVTGEELAQFKPTFKYVSYIKFAPNGYWFLILSTNNIDYSNLQIIDLRRNEEVNSIKLKPHCTDLKIDITSNMIVLAQGASHIYSLYDKKLKKWSSPTTLAGSHDFDKLYNFSRYDDLMKDGFLKFASLSDNNTLTVYELE